MEKAHNYLLDCKVLLEHQLQPSMLCREQAIVSHLSLPLKWCSVVCLSLVPDKGNLCYYSASSYPLNMSKMTTSKKKCKVVTLFKADNNIHSKWDIIAEDRWFSDSGEATLLAHFLSLVGLLRFFPSISHTSVLWCLPHTLGKWGECSSLTWVVETLY